MELVKAMTRRILVKLHDERVVDAAFEYLARKSREVDPDGSFDRQGRWYPSDEEWQTCCDRIRSPSRNYPYSLLTHCRTITHVANLFDVDAKEMQRVVTEARKIMRLAEGVVEDYRQGT